MVPLIYCWRKMNNFWPSKKILITGASGFLGKHLVKNLFEKRRVLAKNLFLPEIKNLDLRRWEDCQKAVKGRDVVIHLAAITGGIEFHRLNPGRIFYDNIIMSVQLMEAARQEKIKKFAAVGSATEYPENLTSLLKEDKLWQGYPSKIHAPYAFAKKILLVQAQAYRQQYNFNAIHLLLANVYGPGMDFGDNSYVIPALIKKIKDAKASDQDFIDVWGSGRPKRDFLYVEDAIEGILLATEKYNKSEPVNIGSGKDISINRLAKILCRLMDFQGRIKFDNSKPDGQMRRLLDISRAKNEFGFSPKTDFRAGLIKTVNAYEDYK